MPRWTTLLLLLCRQSLLRTHPVKTPVKHTARITTLNIYRHATDRIDNITYHQCIDMCDILNIHTKDLTDKFADAVHTLLFSLFRIIAVDTVKIFINFTGVS